jgi:hypothetical protein
VAHVPPHLFCHLQSHLLPHNIPERPVLCSPLAPIIEGPLHSKHSVMWICSLVVGSTVHTWKSTSRHHTKASSSREEGVSGHCLLEPHCRALIQVSPKLASDVSSADPQSWYEGLASCTITSTARCKQVILQKGSQRWGQPPLLIFDWSQVRN